MNKINQQKVLFVQKITENVLETEGLWCETKVEYYVVDNIPFIAKRIALGDIIKCEYEEDDKAYYFDDFVEISGKSTIRLYFENESLIDHARYGINNLRCESEAFLAKKIIAVNVPKRLDYKPLKSYLEKGEKDNKWEYEEACLSHSL